MSRSASLTLAMAILAISAAPARAQDDAATPDPDDSVDTASMGTETGLFESKAVSEGALQAITGRENVAQLSQAELEAEVTNNSVGDNAVTGAARIEGSAFQNMSGLSILNVNTGNNVAINAAMNVNISITPGP